jgi:hypothetical protein
VLYAVQRDKDFDGIKMQGATIKKVKVTCYFLYKFQYRVLNLSWFIPSRTRQIYRWTAVSAVGRGPKIIGKIKEINGS